MNRCFWEWMRCLHSQVEKGKLMWERWRLIRILLEHVSCWQSSILSQLVVRSLSPSFLCGRVRLTKGVPVVTRDGCWNIVLYANSSCFGISKSMSYLKMFLWFGSSTHFYLSSAELVFFPSFRTGSNTPRAVNPCLHFVLIVEVFRLR